MRVPCTFRRDAPQAKGRAAHHYSPSVFDDHLGMLPAVRVVVTELNYLQNDSRGLPGAAVLIIIDSCSESRLLSIRRCCLTRNRTLPTLPECNFLCSGTRSCTSVFVTVEPPCAPSRQYPVADLCCHKGYRWTTPTIPWGGEPRRHQ